MLDTITNAPPSAPAEQEAPEAEPLEPLRISPKRLLATSAIAALACIGIAAYGIADRAQSEEHLVQLTADEAVPTVSVVKPIVGQAADQIDLPGRVDAFFQAPIYARVSGYLRMWYKDIGAPVRKGDLLAEIDAPDLDQELAQAKANLGVAQANYQLAQVTARRWQRLLKSDAVSEQEVDMKSGDAAAKSATVTAAQADVSRLEALEVFKRIVAPFDGVITARRTDVGALINAGSGTGQELFAVAAMHQMRVYVRVPQSESLGIAKGMKASLSLPQYPGKAFAATVDTTSDAINPLSNTLLVELLADNPDGLLRPWTFAQVHLTLPAQSGVVRIPDSALLFRSGGLKVAVVGADGRVTIKPIQAGRDLGNDLEVLSGLAPGDRVINSPSDSLVTGETVRVASGEGNAMTVARK
jgi:RND family efflux transporter MFP subunit